MNTEENRTELEVLFGVILFIASLLLGLLIHSEYSKRKTLSANDILETVKNQFKLEGPIEGSWIEMTTVPWKKFAYESNVYYGGISRLEQNELKQYEFIADAHTGSLIDIYRV